MYQAEHGEASLPRGSQDNQPGPPGDKQRKHLTHTCSPQAPSSPVKPGCLPSLDLRSATSVWSYPCPCAFDPQRVCNASAQPHSPLSSFASLLPGLRGSQKRSTWSSRSCCPTDCLSSRLLLPRSSQYWILQGTAGWDFHSSENSTGSSTVPGTQAIGYIWVSCLQYKDIRPSGQVGVEIPTPSEVRSTS